MTDDIVTGLMAWDLDRALERDFFTQLVVELTRLHTNNTALLEQVKLRQTICNESYNRLARRASGLLGQAANSP